ncbi:hypothetical protein, partial [Curtobacterium sp. S6]|uniref:hypothetical protein n=1 Tax=Curtobacterium sp. S6 TaxID=1479623 RepID=UPI00056CDDD5
MSAFVHGNDHINLLVTYLATLDRESVAGIYTKDWNGEKMFQRLDVAGHDVVYTQRRLGWVLPVATGRQVRGSSHE